MDDISIWYVSCWYGTSWFDPIQQRQSRSKELQMISWVYEESIIYRVSLNPKMHGGGGAVRHFKIWV